MKRAWFFGSRASLIMLSYLTTDGQVAQQSEISLVRNARERPGGSPPGPPHENRILSTATGYVRFAVAFLESIGHGPVFYGSQSAKRPIHPTSPLKTPAHPPAPPPSSSASPSS